jgi:hypothetical protein
MQTARATIKRSLSLHKAVQRHSSGYSSSILPHNSPTSSAPLVQHFRPRWPEPELAVVPPDAALKLPEQRTVSEKVLRFQMSATFSHGTSIFYPHLKFNPADIKVSVKVGPRAILRLSSPLQCFLLPPICVMYRVVKDHPFIVIATSALFYFLTYVYSSTSA